MSKDCFDQAADQSWEFIQSRISLLQTEGIASHIEFDEEPGNVRLYIHGASHPFGGQLAVAIELNFDALDPTIIHDANTGRSKLTGSPEKWAINITSECYLCVLADDTYVYPHELEELENVERLAISVAHQDSQIDESIKAIETICNRLTELLKDTKVTFEAMDVLLSRTNGYVLVNGRAVQFQAFDQDRA